MKSVASLALIGAAAIAAADCAEKGEVTVHSESGRYRLELKPTGEFMIAVGCKVLSQGKLKVVGHHYDAWVSDRGDRIALVDPYAGYAIYDGTGKVLASGEPRKFLSPKERAETPHQWACHKEGEWTGSYKFGERELVMTTYNKRSIRVPLRSTPI